MGLKEYQEKIEAQLKELTARLNELKEKADKAGGEAKAKIYKEMEELRARKDTAQERLTEILTAGADKFEGLKGKLDKAMEDAKKSWENLKSRYF